jgi:hypothetical protein
VRCERAVCLSINVKEAGCRVRVGNLMVAIRFYIYKSQGLEIRLATPFHDPRGLCVRTQQLFVMELA